MEDKKELEVIEDIVYDIVVSMSSGIIHIIPYKTKKEREESYTSLIEEMTREGTKFIAMVEDTELYLHITHIEATQKSERCRHCNHRLLKGLEHKCIVRSRGTPADYLEEGDIINSGRDIGMGNAIPIEDNVIQTPTNENNVGYL